MIVPGFGINTMILWEDYGKVFKQPARDKPDTKLSGCIKILADFDEILERRNRGTTIGLESIAAIWFLWPCTSEVGPSSSEH